MLRRLIVHIDGGSRGNPGPAAIGVVLETDDHEFISRLSAHIGIATSTTAEYRAALAGLREIRRLFPEDASSLTIEIRTDFQPMVNQMAGLAETRRSHVEELVAQIREEMEGLNVQWRWVPREKNGAADTLVHNALGLRGRALRLNPGEVSRIP